MGEAHLIRSSAMHRDSRYVKLARRAVILLLVKLPGRQVSGHSKTTVHAPLANYMPNTANPSVLLHGPGAALSVGAHAVLSRTWGAGSTSDQFVAALSAAAVPKCQRAVHRHFRPCSVWRCGPVTSESCPRGRPRTKALCHATVDT